MNFLTVLEKLTAALDEAGVRYALIGGFAMALRGVQRATMDLDFILLLQDLERAHRILESLGYRRGFTSENVSHYTSDEFSLGRVDLLHAFRGPTLSMLDRAERLAITASLDIPVVQVEDIIGLKIQATVNDPTRHASDWADIRLLIEHCASTRKPLNWELIADYLKIFHLEGRLGEIRKWHESTNPR
jgi:hypothetical protein